VTRRAPLYALYLADAISLSGNALAQLAIPWFVLVTTGSAALTGLAVFFNFLPVVLAGVFGGVIVDRLGFRTTSVLADFASAGAVAAIPALDATVGIELWQLMALVFLGALLDAPGTTARSALFPDVVALAGVRMERATGIAAGSSAARCSSAPRSAACSSRRSARPPLSGSIRPASLSQPASLR
jgi:MFS family permease